MYLEQWTAPGTSCMSSAIRVQNHLVATTLLQQLTQQAGCSYARWNTAAPVSLCLQQIPQHEPRCSDWTCVLCRFVILLSDDKDYFFILYLVYVGMNMLLAGIALLHWPGAEQLELVNDPEGYQVRLCPCLACECSDILCLPADMYIVSVSLCKKYSTRCTTMASQPTNTLHSRILLYSWYYMAEHLST